MMAFKKIVIVDLRKLKKKEEIEETDTQGENIQHCAECK